MDPYHGIKKESISFIPSEEVKNHHKWKKSNTRLPDPVSKPQLPILKGGSAEVFLTFLNEFHDLRSKLGYTNYQKLESDIKQL